MASQEGVPAGDRAVGGSSTGVAAPASPAAVGSVKDLETRPLPNTSYLGDLNWLLFRFHLLIAKCG